MYVIGGISIEGAQAPVPPPRLCLKFWDKIKLLGSFIKKKHLKQN